MIVGGRFGGLGSAQRLARRDHVRITLLDRNNYHQFQPLLDQVSTSLLAPSDIAHSLRDAFAGQDNVDAKLAEISAVDTAMKTVRSRPRGLRSRAPVPSGTPELFIDYLIGSGIMILGGITEIVFGINAEGKSLDDIIKPITSTSKGALPPAGEAIPTTAWQRLRERDGREHKHLGVA